MDASRPKSRSWPESLSTGSGTVDRHLNEPRGLEIMAGRNALLKIRPLGAAAFLPLPATARLGVGAQAPLPKAANPRPPAAAAADHKPQPRLRFNFRFQR